MVLAGLLAVGIWLLLGRETVPPNAQTRIEPPSIPPPPGPAVDPAPTVAARGDQEKRDSTASLELTDIAPAPAQDSDDLARHPHPITPERIRIQRENQLIGAMNDAMDLADGATLHKILEQYENEYPENPNDLQEGYRVIADCLEHPDAQSTAAGQRYYDVERGSILRVFVGRHCLGQ